MWNIEYEIPPLRMISWENVKAGNEAEARAIFSTRHPLARIRAISKLETEVE